jgi:hypothetical protein
MLLPGCESPTKTADDDAARKEAAAARTTAAPASEAASETLRLLAAELNSSRIAASRVASMPAVRNAFARREILLHAAMYRAAFETNVGDWTEHFVLEPVRESNPPDLGIEPEEFRLRVLSALSDLGSPVAWVTETWRSRAVDVFPGTAERATRLRISILERDENAGTVTGEVGDWTADIGASRQGVRCRWDGLAWQVERDPVRMVW